MADATRNRPRSVLEGTGPSTSATVFPSSTTTPGPRATRLQQVFDQALARTLRANSYANFSACFPTPARHVPASLESVWRQLNAKLEESARAEFADIVREREAVALLNELDRMVADARRKKDSLINESVDDTGAGTGEEETIPHMLSPNELYRAHVTPYLCDIRNTVSSKIDDVHAQNAELAKTVQEQRAEIHGLLQGLEDIVADLDSAASAATRFTEENNLRMESVQMDKEVKAKSVT